MQVFPNMFGQLRLPAEGGYGQDMKGRWWFRLPGQDARVIDPRDVQLVAGGTITVSGYITAGTLRGVTA